jgi:hypothetical protein
MAYFLRNQRLSFIFEPYVPWDEQQPTPLPQMKNPDEHFTVRSWSPDGSRLGGNVRTSNGEDAGVAIYHLESQQYEKLTEFGGFPTAWLSDGRRLLFWVWQHGVLYMTDTVTKEPREVFSIAPDHFVYATLSGDNRTIYFGRVENEADIWLLTQDEERK